MEIVAKREVKNKKINPAWDKEGFQEKVLKDCFLFWKLPQKNKSC